MTTLLMAIVILLSCTILRSEDVPEKLNYTYGHWECHMLGFGTPELVKQARQDCSRRVVKMGLVGTGGINRNTIGTMFHDGSTLEYRYGSPETAKNSHDDAQIYEAMLLANLLHLRIQLTMYQPIPGVSLETCFDRAGAESDIVICYHSFWDARLNRAVAQIMKKHPDTLYILPCGEVGPPTGEALQAYAAHADGTGVPNLCNTMPLSRHGKGSLHHPSARDERDTQTANFVAPSSYADSPGTTCPSVGVTAVVAGYIVASCEKKPNCKQILQIMHKGTSIPAKRMLLLVDFDQEAVDHLKEEMDFLTHPDKFGTIRLVHPGVLDLLKIRKIITDQRKLRKTD